MILNYDEMTAAAAANPALVLVSCTKEIAGLEPDGVTEMFQIAYTNPPANFKLHADPYTDLNGDIYALLVDLDYAI